MSAENPFDKPESTPSFSFSDRDQYGQLVSKPIGTRLGGTVTKGPEPVQSRFYEGTDKGKPMYWQADGKGHTADPKSPNGLDNPPVKQIVVTVIPPGASDPMSLWIKEYPKDMFDAIKEALTLPNGTIRAIEPGDQLFVTLTGKRPVPGKNPAHTYSAEFIKGAGAFSVAAPPPPPAAAAPVAPAPAPPVPPTEPVLSNGFTASALRAAGWTEAQIASLSAPAPVAAPPAAPPPPVATEAAPAASDTPPVETAPAASAEPTEREKKLAEMTPEDRALLGL